MKKLFLILCLSALFLYPTMAFAQTRFQIAGASYIDLGEDQRKPTLTLRSGFSTKMFDFGPGAFYTAALGKFGEAGDIKGAELDVIYFPVRPSGTGLKGFVIFGPDVSITDFKNEEGEVEIDPVTYLQLIIGGGLHFEASNSLAFWAAGRLGTVLNEKYTTFDIGIGLSLKLFASSEDG